MPDEGDQITERHGRARRPDRDDVAEDRGAVVGPFEAPSGTEVGVGEIADVGRARLDQRGRSDRHTAVDDHGREVARQTDGEDAHADEVEVAEGEDQQRGRATRRTRRARRAGGPPP